MKERVEIIEIGPREGLQNHPVYIDVSTKVSFINRLFTAGFRRIEVAAFVHPREMPQMKDAVDIMRSIETSPNRVAQALVPNETGCRNAIAAGAGEIVVWSYPTDELNYQSLNRDRSRTFKEINSVVQIASVYGIRTSAWIGGAFGYPGMKSAICREVKEMIEGLLQIGCAEVCLSDEFCMANPPLVKKLLYHCLEDTDASRIMVHFHDNRGLGLANIFSAYEQGIRKFKACIGGAGIHTDLVPSIEERFDPSMYPSVPTEDLVYVLEEIGVDTGIDMDALVGCGRLAEDLLQTKLYSRVLTTGLVKKTGIRN